MAQFESQNVAGEEEEEGVTISEEQYAQFPIKKQNNTLPLFGNKDTMNINSMILTNILESPYFKQDLFQLKTFHEVIDEVYYRVEHLEPWEKNSRKLAGQVGMCAGVRGVAAGGIVSTPFCLLFKLFTLRLTRKQVNVMLNHSDSPHIRGLGFLYIRYCQPPKDFWDWFYPYLQDEEEIELRAGGGLCIPMGEMCRMLLTRQDWFGTMFPRIPVNVQKVLEEKLKQVKKLQRAENAKDVDSQGKSYGSSQADGEERHRHRSRERSQERSRERHRSPHYRRRRDDSRERRRDDSRERRRDRDRTSRRDRSRDRSRDRGRRHRSRSRSHDRYHRSSRHRSSRSRSRERKRHRSRSRSYERRKHRSHS